MGNVNIKRLKVNYIRLGIKNNYNLYITDIHAVTNSPHFTLYTTWQSMWTSTLAANWWGTCGHTAVKKEAIETVSETLMKGQMVVWSFAIQCDVMWYRLHWETGDTADVRFELNPRVKKEGALSEGVFRSVMLWVCFIWGVFVPGGFVGIWILWCVYVCGLPTLVVVSSYTWCGVV